MTLKVWTNVPLNLTLQHSSHTENKWQMHLCAAQIILHAHLMVGRLCNIPYVSYSLNELRKQKQNNASTEYRLFKHNSVIMYAKQTLLICFFFLFYKRSIKWCQLTHYHRTAVTLQVRQCGEKQFTFCIHKLTTTLSATKSNCTATSSGSMSWPLTTIT